MTALPVALSLSDTFTKIGAIAAFAALAGIAILALLLFSQARELKRLREWAGRAPERSAELEQRVTAGATARVQQVVPPPVPPVRQVPRTTPVVARPVAAAATGPATRVVASPATSPVETAQGTPGAPAVATGSPAPPQTPGQVTPVAPGEPTPASIAPGQTPSPGEVGAIAPATAAGTSPPGAPAGGPAAPATAAASTASGNATAPPSATGEAPAPPIPPVPGGGVVASTGDAVRGNLAEQPANAPVDDGLDAARAQAQAPDSSPAAAGKAPQGESPASTSGAPATAAAAAAARAGAPASATPRAPTPPAAASAPSPAVPVSQAPAVPRPSPSTSRPPAPSDSRRDSGASAPVRAAAAARQAERLSDDSRARRSDPAGVSVHRVRRSPARATMLIVGGVVVVVVAVVLVLSLHGGGKSSGKGSTTAGNGVAKAGSGAGAHKQTSSHQVESSVAASPANIAVVVLNGTDTNGLAHSLANELQQGGYSQAAAMNGTPPGSHATTVVEYASGHRADAQGVASALSVARVQPIETAVSSLAGSATVVVVAGEDKAATVGETSEAAGASSAAG